MDMRFINFNFEENFKIFPRFMSSEGSNNEVNYDFSRSPSFWFQAKTKIENSETSECYFLLNHIVIFWILEFGFQNYQK